MATPITPRPVDEKRLRAAVQDANLPTLIMVLFHLTGDERWLRDPYRPRRSRGLGPNDSGGFPPQVADEIRAAAVRAVCAWGRGAPVAVPAPERALLREMLTICMGEEVPDEYEQLMREEMGLTTREPEGPLPAEEIGEQNFSVVVIGAGISGLIAGVQLREAGIPFVILERNDEVGGVWLTNTYPGAGVDTPSYLYSFSFFQRPWSTHFGKRDEMAGYLKDTADYFGLRQNIVFGTEATSAVYDEVAQRWDVTASGPDGEQVYSAAVVISAVGLFNKPKIPDLPGMSSFRRPVFHTADWPDDLDLTGKRVAVVGTGASAMQVVPAIAGHVASLTVFQRSPQWVGPCAEYFKPVGEAVHWLMDHVPYYYDWYRFRLAWVFNDRVHPSLQIDPEWEHPDISLNAVNDGHRRYFTRYITDQLAGRPDLVEKCLPDYPPFGKRMLLDNGWYAALKKPNVELVTAGVERMTETAVVSDDGRTFDVDVVVLSTGFQTHRYLQPLEVVGRQGAKLREVWGDDDATAYLGITTPGFPNLFFMYGPNTNSGAGGSYFFIGESQGRYIMDMLRKMVRRRLGAVECRQDVHDRWIDEIDAAHSRMVWSHPGMSTYYRNSSGRVVSNSPYRIIDYWALTHDANLDDFIVERAVAKVS
ncbi:MAG TPA: NAD(P)-binding domain-containing protein [Amycolatopsis sp.]|nr:NAD(P)-binding domain-containing protein [Amycolatopsis sp.]